MKYYISDIIRRAKQIADLENSDFISWNENVQMVNEAWTTLYQKLVNKNDKSFIQEIEIRRGKNILPEDFYQLSSVVTFNNRLVSKYTAGMTESDISYEIKNGFITLRGTDSARVNYFPAPQTLTYRNEVVDLTDAIESSAVLRTNNALMGNGHYLLTVKGVFDIDSCTDKLVFEANKTRGYIDASGNYYEGVTGIKMPDGTTRNIVEEFPAMQSVIDGSSSAATAQYSYIGDVILQVMPGASRVYAYNPSTGEAYSEEFVKNMNEHWVEKMLCVPTESNGTIFYCTDKFAYINDMQIFDITQLKGTNATALPLFLKFDMNTGYGFYCNGKVYPITVDTFLNFPNNIYYTLMAYQLAYNYCCKQSKDVSFVSSQLAMQWEVYYDTLTNDDWSQEKIINTYRFRG